MVERVVLVEFDVIRLWWWYAKENDEDEKAMERPYLYESRKK